MMYCLVCLSQRSDSAEASRSHPSLFYLFIFRQRVKRVQIRALLRFRIGPYCCPLCCRAAVVPRSS